MPKEKSAGAIIYRLKDNVVYYLLLHYRSGHWEFARGHIEEGEDEKQTVKREVEEETGIKDLHIDDIFKEHTKFVFKRTYNLKPEDKKKAPWVFKVVTLYLAQTQTEEVKISDEHIGFEWLPYEKAFKKLTYKPAKEAFKKANDYLVSTKGI